MPIDSHNNAASPVRDGLRTALQLSDSVARLGSYALTNQSRAEHAALQIVQAFEAIGAHRPSEAAVQATALDALDALARLKKLLSTPSTNRIVPPQVRSRVLEDAATLERHVVGLIRASRTPSRESTQPWRP